MPAPGTAAATPTPLRPRAARRPVTPDAITVTIAFVREALARLPDAGARSRVLAQAGIAPRLLDDGKARVSAHQYAAVWLGCNRELGDEIFGLDRPGMPPGAFLLICRSVLSSRRFGQGLRRALKAFALFLPRHRATLEVDGDDAWLVLPRAEAIDPADPASAHARFAQEVLATVLHGVMCWMAGDPVRFSRAEFAYPRPPHWHEYLPMFSRTLRFDAPRSALCFDARWLERPLQLDDARCQAFVASAPLSIFVKYRNPESWTSRVREALRATPLEDWPVLRDMALRLEVAPSTFARRLAEEGTSYQGLKDDLRRDRAVQLLCDTRRPVAEIAAELGFEEASAFYRAFRRWTGGLPGDYRDGATARA